MRARTLPLLLVACTGDKEPHQVASNNPPVVASLALQPDPAYAADAVTAVVTTSDLDGDALTLRFTWTLDGEELSADGESLPAFTAIRDQEIAVEVTVSDGFSFGVPGQASLVIANSAPVLEGIAIDPATPQLGDPLTCEISDRDDDGDALTRQFAWFIEGEERTFSGQTWTEDLDRNTAVYCEAWVTDGDLDSERLQSQTVYVGNSPPGAPQIALSPNPPTACSGGSVLITRDAYDPDGDAITYRYSWQDEAGTEVCGDATCAGGIFTVRELYTVYVSAWDGGLEGPAATLSFTAVDGGESFGNGVDDDCDGQVDEWITRAWQAQQLWWSDASGGEAGFALAAGDVGGDGRDDAVLIGNGSGELLIFSGASMSRSHPVLDAPDLTLDDMSSPNQVALTDVDGDGLDDVLVSALGADGGAGTDVGAVYVLLGAELTAAAVADVATWWVEGDDRQERLGQAVAGGDLDGDGYGDVAVGEPMADAPAREAGEVYVFLGVRGASGAAVGSDADLTFGGGSRNGHFGTSVAVLADIDGDGFHELAVGAPDADGGGTDSGSLGLWFGGAMTAGYLSDADVQVDGDAASAFLGREPADAADVDGDGLAELIVGSEGRSGALVFPGTGWLFLGSSLTGGTVSAAAAHARVEGDANNAALGLYGSGFRLGDTDGDGRAELLGGAGGSGYIYLWNADELAAGGDLGVADAAIALLGEDSPDDRFGRQVVVGDLDGDGAVELLATASRAGALAEQAGALYAFDPPYGVAADPWSPDCEAGSGYVLCRTPATWSEALSACEALGLTLAHPDTSSANSALAAEAAARYVVGSSRGRWWIGLTDAASEGAWVWADGTAPSSTGWTAGAPSSSTSNNCAAVNTPTEGTWRDLGCETELLFICE
ncbi:MAG: FG-GAP repeat protein [Alphaproteobacteria bacterium]|nr:FG-GAP repeat protein [Alphaproteobacteria bacterium]